MGNTRTECGAKVYLDPDLYQQARRLAHQSEASLSRFLCEIIRKELAPKPAVRDRVTTVLEFQSIQLDLLLRAAGDELPAEAKRIFRKKTGGEGDAL